MQETQLQETAFPGRIHRKLSLIFTSVFLLVLLVGGGSLYLAYSIFLSTQEIKQESERIDLVDQMHYTTHHFISALHRASLGVTALEDSARMAHLRDLNALWEQYRAGSTVESGGVAEGIPQVIGDLGSVSETIVKQTQPFSAVSPTAPDRRNLEILGDVERRIQALAHALSGMHRNRMEQKVRENRWKIQLILGFYATFVLVGALLILGISIFFSRTIARPLRILAQGASEVAQGNFQKQVPVQSKDEIGQLSHAFNTMIERLREHEEKLKGLATLEERERIAQELHDNLAQSIALLHLKLAEAEGELASDASETTRETLKEMRQITDSAYADVRQAIFGLRTMVSKELSFIPTLTEYLHEFSEMRKTSVDLKIPNPEAIRFSPQVEIQIIRIIHEALSTHLDI